MRRSFATWWNLVGWLLVVSYVVASLAIPPGTPRTIYGDIAQCIAPIFAISGLLLNANSSQWRKNVFWMLLAVGCGLWMAGQLLWTYIEIVQRRTVPTPFSGDIIFFLHAVPMIAALTLQPHRERGERSFRVGSADFSLLLLWWLYLYAFIVFPWQFIRPDEALYGFSYNALLALENMVFLCGVGILCFRTKGYWRVVYAHLFAAAFLYNLASQTINVAIDLGKYSTGSLYDLPLVGSFAWLGTAGLVARNRELADTPAASPQSESIWRSRLATMAVLSLPAMALWSISSSTAPPVVQQFRLYLTLGTIIGLTVLVFFRHHLVDQERLRLLSALRKSFENLKHLQTQMAQADKLASLGQLTAGAAHEINNPLTAILGYSQLLLDQPTLGDKLRGFVEKIREQASRTRDLVSNMLSFSRQVPTEKALVDIPKVMASALQLCTIDLRNSNIQISLDAPTSLPPVEGDSNQLLQVFFNVISNALYALEEVGGGRLTLRTSCQGAFVIVEITDTGPGIRQPQRVFDPFYTTKPVGKGTGLGLSICYGIVMQHGGQITCYNEPKGGATFRIELPAMAPLGPRSDAFASQATPAAAR